MRAEGCGWRISNSTADSRGQGSGSVRPHPKVRFQKPVTLLQLTATQFGIAHHLSRHKLGLSYPALPHQKNPLVFFGLLPQFSTDHPTHKRVVCGSNQAPPEFHIVIIELCKAHRPTPQTQQERQIGWYAQDRSSDLNAPSTAG